MDNRLVTARKRLSAGTVNASTDITAGTLPIARGGTATGSTPTNGQLLIGNGTNYSLATLTAGTNIAVTNGSGTISVATNTTQFNDANGNELVKWGTTASAVNEVTITNAATGGNASITATGGDTDINLYLAGKGVGTLLIGSNINMNGKLICDGSFNEEIEFTATASAVNHIMITNAATGVGPTISATGSDTNVSLNLLGKGTGVVNVECPFRHRQTYSPINTEADAATITFDLSQSNRHETTLGGNRTLALTGELEGQWFILFLAQDATGSRTVTWWSGIDWAGGSAPTLTTTASKLDTFAFYVVSAGNYRGYVVGANTSV